MIEIDLNIQLKTLSFTFVPEAGLIIKIEKIARNSVLQVPKKNKNEKNLTFFHFHYNFGLNSYVGELTEAQYASDLYESEMIKNYSSRECIISTDKFAAPVSMFSNSNRDSNLNLNAKPLPQINSERNTKSEARNITENETKFWSKYYGENIHTLRLRDNAVCEIEEMNTEEKEELEQLESQENKESVFNNVEEKDEFADENGLEVKTMFKNRKQFFEALNQNHTPKVIRNLKWTANILVLCLIAMAFSSHFVNVLEFQQVLDTLNLKVLQDRKISEMVYVVKNIQYLILLNKGVFGNATDTLENKYKNQIMDSLTLIKQIEDELQSKFSSFSQKQSDMLKNNVVQMFFNSNNFQFFDLNQASQQIISKILNVANLPLKQFALDEPNTFFVMFNLFNDYYLKLQIFSDYFVMNMNYMIDKKKSLFLTLLILSVILVFFSIILLTPFVFKLNNFKDQILILFLDIPSKVLKKLLLKCENFLTTLQVGDEDEIMSERSGSSLISDDNGDNTVDGQNTFKKRKKRKKSKKSTQGRKKMIFSMICFVTFFEIYFGMNYFLSDNLIGGLVPMVKEANDTSKAEAIFAFYNLGLRFFF